MAVFRVKKRAVVRLFLTPQRPLRRLAYGLGVGLIVGGLVAAGLWLNLFDSIRTRLTDGLYLPRPTRGIVTIVAIDDASLSAYGRSVAEWPRTLHADLIRQLDTAGARVIVFDVLFAEPVEGDDDLAEAMRQSRKVIMSVAGSQSHTPTTRAGSLISYDYFIHPVSDLETTAAGIGHVNVVPDDDGFVRRIPLFIREGDQTIPALGFAAYIEYLRMLPEMAERETNVVHFAGRDLYTDDIGQMLIYFFGPRSHASRPGTFQVVSLVDVLEGRVPPDTFNDRIVLIGALDSVGLPDNYPTPSTGEQGNMFGVEIHANMIETIHQSLPSLQANVDWTIKLGPLAIPLYQGNTSLPLREQPYQQQIVIAVLLAVGAGAVLPFLRWYLDLVTIVLVYAAYWFWASASFTIRGEIVELLFPGVSLVLVFMGTLITGYIFEERRRNQINDLFSRYVSPEIAHKIVEEFDHGRLELGGEEREITVLFADVRGFTTLSENMQPAEVVRVLNVFLEEMNAIVMDYGGAINKYIGDNIMAFWNAPYPQADHAWLGVQAGLDMQACIERLNREHRFAAPIQFGIGINTGPVIVGNIGSEKRLEYTPIGDTVNVASRLCGVAPGGVCYVGGRTCELVQGRVQIVEVHHLKLKGKQDTVEVFEINRADEIMLKKGSTTRA